MAAIIRGSSKSIKFGFGPGGAWLKATEHNIEAMEALLDLRDEQLLKPMIDFKFN